MKESKYHEPVLLEESIEGLNIKPDGIYVDLTFGNGGHSNEILKKMSSDGKLIVFDQDEDAEKNKKIVDNRLIFVRQNFKYLTAYLKLYSIEQVDGVLGDWGVASHQFDTPERGFSIRFDGPLDMRMNQSSELTAEQIINGYSDVELTHILKTYGEVHKADKIVKQIVQQRKFSKFKTVDQFKDVLKPFLGKNPNKDLAKIFQALRIEVNQELEVLKEVIQQVAIVLKDKGRFVSIAYHSLEDRLVKNFIKAGNFDGIPDKDIYGRFEKPLKAINRKVIVPSEAELKRNSRSRSAKLRIAEKN